ncbi:MAG: hypothetical protein OEZ39_20080 [Gammaproteobacteria bacterium]|nr:hypothetical protein [Gammaproteobacteria bacterium]MDH5654168.1 hypothetical protein [Gammaproteobacteria bacterium]
MGKTESTLDAVNFVMANMPSVYLHERKEFGARGRGRQFCREQNWTAKLPAGRKPGTVFVHLHGSVPVLSQQFINPRK